MTTTEAPPITVDTVIAPGVYDDIPEAIYHKHKHSISSTGLKTLTKSPAKYRFGEREDSPALTFGKLAHRILLGKGEDFVVSPFESFRTAEAKAWKAEQEAAGRAIVTQDAVDKAHAMVKALRDDPDCGPLYTDGRPEVSLFWIHPSGVTLRARYDWFREPAKGRRLLIPDYKTTEDASPWEFDNSVGRYGYFQSAALYVDGAIALGLDPDPLFLLVAQEKSPPYIAQTYYINEADLQLGRELNERAIRIYARCLETDTWPKYRQGASEISLRPYHAIPAQEILDDNN